jgi:hypothetical protein
VGREPSVVGQRIDAGKTAARAVLVVAGRRDLRITHAVADEQNDVPRGGVVVVPAEPGGRDSDGGRSGDDEEDDGDGDRTTGPT